MSWLNHILRLSSIGPWFAACLALLFSFTAHANDITDKIADGTISIKGGTYVADGDAVVITYTAEKIATDGAGSLNITAGQAGARVLAIGGGGGGGGTPFKTDARWGAGGGGGAGGFVEASGLTFKGTYAISVGTGGAGVKANTSGEGGDGGNTTITQNGTQLSSVAVAKGGGGGGGGGSVYSSSTFNGSGRSGGSGGGASLQYRSSSKSYARNGGVASQGFRGGNTTDSNNSYWIGAGGGGAGGAGTDVATYNQAGGAPGGAGKASDITGTLVVYASGGAGGAMDKSGIGTVAAKEGGGGSGGTTTNTGSRDGTPATGGGGGGGGGGSNSKPSGAGGSGVLIIRLSNYIAGGVKLPEIPAFVYDGHVKTAAVNTVYYTVSGNHQETAANDKYTLTLKLTAEGRNVGWDDTKGTEDRNLNWSIAKKPIAKPVTKETSYTYTGSEQEGFTNSVWYTVEEAKRKATDAGTYTPYAELTDSANTKWADGSPTKRTDLSWKIGQMPIAKPAATAKSWIYTGNVQTGFVENVSLYKFDAQNRSINAGTFTPTAELVDAKNTMWADGAANPRSDFEWTMAPMEVAKPEARDGLVFNTQVQTGAVDAAVLAKEYTLSGHLQTNAGNYQFVAHLNNPVGVTNYRWKGSEAADLTVDWSIAQKVVDPPQTPDAEIKYTYNGAVHTPFPASTWYTIVKGTGSEQNVGDYSCTLKLNYNETVKNTTWKDVPPTVEELSWDWSITAKSIAIPPSSNFVYDENPRGTAVERTLFTVPADAEWTLDTSVSDELKQKEAGTYIYTVNLKDPDNTAWTDGTTGKKDIECKIEQAQNEIQGLKMDDWQAGSAESSPWATVKFGSTLALSYTYSDSAEGPWSVTKLTANGYHYVRASTEETKNWTAAEAKKRYCVWTHPSLVFSDYVDITASGYTGGTAKQNFPVCVPISEAKKSDTGAVTGGLPGFTYDRAGKKGDLIRFLSDNGTPDNLADDQLLPYEVEKWDVTGDSVVWVRLPKLQGKTTKFRMYWHTDDPKSANDPTLVWSDWKKSDCGLSKVANFYTYDLVNVAGSWVDYWTKKPSLTGNKTDWSEGEITEADVDKGTLKRNNPVSYIYIKMPLERETNTVVQTQGGIYRVVCDMTVPDDGEKYTLFDGPATLEYTVIATTPDVPVGGTSDGRTLLANNDTREGHEITGQSYWDTDPTKPTFWWHNGTKPNAYMRNLRNGDQHVLYQYVTPEETNVLWRIYYAWLGNWYINAGSAYASRNYLPCSNTARPLADPSVQSSMTNVTHIVLHDTPNAIIYSPCYTNGIGTIYFDTVNADITDPGAELVVEVAKKTTRDGDRADPTDKNCAREDDPFYYLTHTEDGVQLFEDKDMWEPVVPYVMIKQKGSSTFVRDTAQPYTDGRMKLTVKNGGGTDVFYRIAVKVNYAKPVRFRIKRAKKSGSGDDDKTCLTLVDEILVTKPAMSAKLTAVGEYDEDLLGKQTLGQACGFDKPFPAWTESNIRGRAKVEYETYGEKIDTSKFIASAKLNYRWRYLNQSFEPEKLNGKDQWKTSYLNHEEIKDNILTTVWPLEFKPAQGDIEWYYDMTLQMPSYKFCDYTGLDLGTGDYVESPRVVTNHYPLATGERLASAGSDWFVRLREGKSDWQGMQVVIEAGAGAKNVERFIGAHDMEIVGDNMWRVFVNIPTNAEGTCSFKFRGLNQQTGSPTEIMKNAKTFGLSKEGQVAAIPANGTLTEGGYGAQFTIDHAAGYLEFKVSDYYKTFQVGRAEYQDFNYWNDAHTSGDKFCINSSDTNSVNVSGMTISQAPFGEWPFFTETNSVWNEGFIVADYAPTEGRFMKDIFHQSHETPNSASWSAKNITFVSERFVKNTVDEQKKQSGMAGKLLGNGSGVLDFSNSAAPQGLEKIDLTVRLGQSDVFDGFAWCKSSFADDNYMLFVPITMSHNTDEKEGKLNSEMDMAVGASVSLVGYYQDKIGSYEVRCERLFSGNTIRLSLWKWTYQEQKYTNTRLAYRDFDVPCWSYEKNTDGTPVPEGQRRFYGMFMSLETTYKDGEDGDLPSLTKIVFGLSNAKQIPYADIDNPWKCFSYSTDTARKDIKWNGLIYEDKSNPHGWGSYGMTSKDCPAQMIMPAHREVPYDTARIASPKDNKDGKGVSQGGKYFADEKLVIDDGSAPAFVDDRYSILKKRLWATNPGRTECFTNTAAGSNRWIGFHAPTDITQTLELYLKEIGTDESQWKQVSTPVEVSGYGFKQASFDVKRAGQWDVRLKTGAAKAIDVVVDQITQYKWQADSYPYYDPISKTGRTPREDEFMHTQCCVETNTAKKTNYSRMQPARALATRPVSIRSPLLDGLGKFSFEYQGVDKNAEIWVQVATNSVHGSMTGDGGYNESIESVEEGEPQTIGKWLTVKKYRYSGSADPECDLGDNGSKSVYLGWHNHVYRPLKGVWRLFVPPHVVKAANIAATNATQNVHYGELTVTSVVCTDEPGFSDRSWRGWNMRTVGDSKDSEKRMNLVDMRTESGQGLVGALNNSAEDVYEKGEKVTSTSPSWERLISSYPAIYSPLMRPVNKRSGVGSVTFKARLYSTTGVPETANGAWISVYGSNDPTGPESGWKLLTRHEIRSSVFSNFTWTAGSDLYTAVRLIVVDPELEKPPLKPTVDRVILDEIVIGEKVPPTINFEYARPFRNNLFKPEPIEDILSPAEQPLAGESWGVQTKLSLQQLTDEIDVEKGFEVYFMYQRGTSPWGYGKWTSGSEPVKLVQVGDASNLVFRSVGDSPKSLVEPALEIGEVVQFMVKVKYFDRGGKSDELTMGSEWQQPDWFYPLDYNADNGGYDVEENFAAYTVLDTVSPGRAWINEVNWNDGTKYQTGGKKCTTNQFIEVCIPSGVDMTGWKLRMTDSNEKKSIFAKFGDAANGIPSKKVSATAVNGYEFFVLQSPSTRDAGGIRYPGTKESAADATWYANTLGTEVSYGTLELSSPYQFELIRPSGIIEHQFVLDGTNTLSEFDWAAIYDGTNLVKTLNADGSPLRFYAGHDIWRKTDGKTLASVGVTGGKESADTADWPGGSNTWTEAMGFTPGRINEGQVIPKGWFLAPNGTNSWVYFLLDTDHISQTVGQEKGQSILSVVPQGRTTNVVYDIDAWFDADISLNGSPVLTDQRGAGIKFSFSPTGTTYVTASAYPQKRLAADFGLDEKNPYSSSVLSWLRDKYGHASADDIRLARFKGLQNLDDVNWLTLTDMYWLDIPPVPVTEQEKLTNNGTNWWLRGGINKFGRDHKIYRTRNEREVTYTNKQVDVTMYISNACTQAKWAPYMLQGLGYESSTNYVGVWTSVTFKIKSALALSSTTNFLPFRIFTFQPDSFTGAAGDATLSPPLDPFSSRIDIMDPFQSPIGVNYGWDKHSSSAAYFKWVIDEKEYPYTTEKLKADSTYPETVP